MHMVPDSTICSLTGYRASSILRLGTKAEKHMFLVGHKGEDMKIKHTSGVELTVPNQILEVWGGYESGELDEEWDADEYLIEAIQACLYSVPPNQFIDKELALFYRDFAIADCDECIDEEFSFEVAGINHTILIFGPLEDGQAYITILGYRGIVSTLSLDTPGRKVDLMLPEDTVSRKACCN